MPAPSCRPPASAPRTWCVTDLIARHQLPIAVATLDTGKLHAQTLALIPRIEQRYGLQVERYAPVARGRGALRARRTASDAMYRSIELRKACCELRKLRAAGAHAGRRAAPGSPGCAASSRRHRGDVPFSERDDDGRTKFNPLADWSWADVWHYIATHDVPYNPLHDQFMPSIGCAPCTRAIAVGEDFRAGRWWWEDEKRQGMRPACRQTRSRLETHA